MTPVEHSLLSKRDFGGEWKDYIELHRFLDSTKAHLPNWKHRSILHNTFGMELCERIFGDALVNSDGVPVSVRELARRHIGQDLNGHLPTLQDWFQLFQTHPDARPSDWARRPKASDLKWLRENVYAYKPEPEPDSDSSPYSKPYANEQQQQSEF